MRNRIRCKECGDVIESTHRHDFKVCSCWDSNGKGCGVDGGQDYHRRLGSNYEEVPDREYFEEK